MLLQTLGLLRVAESTDLKELVDVEREPTDNARPQHAFLRGAANGSEKDNLEFVWLNSVLTVDVYASSI